MKINYLLLICFTILLLSCQSTPKDINYFQDIDTYLQQNPIQNNPVLRIGDRLLINVSSPTQNQELVAQFNLPANSHLGSGDTSLNQSPSLQTYTIDSGGYIDFPVLGKLKLADLTKEQAIADIKKRVSKYVTEPIIDLQIISFNITVLGEVKNPRNIGVRNDRISILEALGAVGDLTIHGDRKNILIIREEGGQKITKRLDLTKSDVLSSPYYYLQQNDVVYVEANDARKRASKFGAAESYNLSIYSIALSTISLLASTVITIISINNKKN